MVKHEYDNLRKLRKLDNAANLLDNISNLIEHINKLLTKEPPSFNFLEEKTTITLIGHYMED